MPSIPIHPPSLHRTSGAPTPSPGFPQILQTPSGLALLEIQGTINSTLVETGDAPQPVGKVVFPGYDAAGGADDTSWHKRVYLYVGQHQRLTGELKKLAKPLAVVRRRASSGAEAELDMAGNDGDALEIAEIVRYKLLFAHRPEPVGAEQSNADA